MIFFQRLKKEQTGRNGSFAKRSLAVRKLNGFDSKLIDIENPYLTDHKKSFQCDDISCLHTKINRMFVYFFSAHFGPVHGGYA